MPGARSSSPHPAVFLDRDGTLNVPIVRAGKPFPPARVDEFELCSGAQAACRALSSAGFVLVVVTNQPDVGRGTQSASEVDAIHTKLQALIPEIARIEVCFAAGDPPAHPLDRRRKPEPGMILDAAEALQLDLRRSWLIGDRWRDIDCGHRAGLRTIFIDHGYDERLRAQPDFTVASFVDAAGIVLAHV